MAKEIERKFLVTVASWTPKDEGTYYKQGYLSSNKERIVRIRIAGAHAMITIKGLTRGVSRTEFEYAVPVEDAHAMLDELCEQPVIEKQRHREAYGGHTWEIDVFHGQNEGLVVAEIELGSEQEPFERPPWAGAEVSADPRYFNSSLINHPYKDWK